MNRLRLFILSITSILFFTSCETEKQIIEQPFYFYDFETDYRNIDSVYISVFEDSRVIGPFNNDGFSFKFDNLPEHEFIRLKFDLFIHDSWEGNTNNTQADTPDHDAWVIELDPHRRSNPADHVIFETTFSNGLCVPGWCYGQSYPNQYPFHNEARVETSRNTFGRCLWQSSPIGSSVYKIDKVFPHTKADFLFVLYDKLKQDGAPLNPLCEESWSLDNLEILLLSKD